MKPVQLIVIKALILIVALVLHASAHAVSSGFNFKVEPLPLTTTKQKDKGIPGGEGFQLVMTIAYASSNPSIVYMGSDTSQVWKSIDGGASWLPKNQGYLALGSRSLFVLPDNDKIVFSAASLGKTYQRAGNKDPHQGIYRSLDGAESWQLVHETDFFKQDSRGTLFALDSRTLKEGSFTIYSGSYNEGLMVSSDSGQTWSKAGFNLGKIVELLELPNRPGSLLIASTKGLYLYKDGDYREIGVGLATWPRSISVSPDRPEQIYAALGPEGIYRSFDGGETFPSKSNLTYLFGSINEVESSPVEGDYVIATQSGKGGKPFYSNDGGKSWKPSSSTNSKGISPGGGFLYPSPVAYHPTNKLQALTSSNGKARILKTADAGDHWYYSSSGYSGGRLRSVVFTSSNKMIFNLTDHGAWRTEDGGEAFRAVNHPRKGGRSVGAGAKAGDIIVLSVGGWQDKKLLTSYDDGVSWNDTNLKGRLRFIKRVDSNPAVFYAGNYRSRDKGRSWQPLPHEVVAADPKINNRLYALDDKSKRARLLVSTDGGDQWKPIGTPLPTHVKKINRVELDPFSTGRIYLATSSGLYINEDITKDRKWLKVQAAAGLELDPFGGNFIDTVVAHPLFKGLLFAGKRSPGAGMANGIFYSEDAGDSWEPLSGKPLNNMNIWSININPYDGTVYVGTSHGIYKVGVVSRDVVENK